MRANFRCLLAAVIILTSLVVAISPATAHQLQKETTPVSETSRTARKTETVEVVESEISGAVVRIDTSSGAVLDNQLVSRDGEVTIEAITILRGTSFIDIFFIDDESQLPSEYVKSWEDSKSATVSFMEWLGGEHGPEDSWGVYSASHYLDYRDYYYVNLQANRVGGMHLAVIVNGDGSAFANDISWIQDYVTIDAASALPDANVSLITAIAAGNSDYQAEDISRQGTTVQTWEDEGLISETAWQSTDRNIALGWDGNLWGFTFNRSDAIVITETSALVVLETPDRRGMTKIRILDADRAPEDWVEAWLSDEYQEREAQSGFVFTVLDSYFDDTTGSVILQFETRYGDPVIVIRDVYMNDNGPAIMTEIFATPEDIATVYGDFWDGVQADGDYYPLTWTIEDIKSVVIN